MPRAEAFISLHADTSVHHPSLLLTQIPVPRLVLPIPVGREPGVADTMCQGGCRPSFWTPEPGGRREGLGFEVRGGRGGRRGTWSFWCLLAWFPALPATAPGSVNALEEIVPRVCLGAAQRLALDRHSLPPACPESPAARQALSSRSWTSVVKGPGGMAPGGPVIP